MSTRDLSIVVPTWCEAERIGALVSGWSWADEVIVADADSPDGTAEQARRAGARVVRAPKGRGAQLRAGAEVARGEVLLFLHADVDLGPAARPAIERALADPEVVGGNFRLRFAPETRAARVFTWANDARRRHLRIYYGDSGIFVRRDVYDRVGGIPTLPLFEDYEFAKRLERTGRTAYVTDVELVASARRFAEAPTRTLCVWVGLQVLYSGGVPADALARLYADLR